jgi:hypothetical protein
MAPPSCSPLRAFVASCEPRMPPPYLLNSGSYEGTKMENSGKSGRRKRFLIRRRSLGYGGTSRIYRISGLGLLKGE